MESIQLDIKDQNGNQIQTQPMLEINVDSVAQGVELLTAAMEQFMYDEKEEKEKKTRYVFLSDENPESYLHIMVKPPFSANGAVLALYGDYRKRIIEDRLEGPIKQAIYLINYE